MAKNNEIEVDKLEKKTDAKAIMSQIAGVVYFAKGKSWGIVDLNSHGQLTGDMDILPYLIEELQGIYEVYGPNGVRM